MGLTEVHGGGDAPTGEPFHGQARAGGLLGGATAGYRPGAELSAPLRDDRAAPGHRGMDGAGRAGLPHTEVPTVQKQKPSAADASSSVGDAPAGHDGERFPDSYPGGGRPLGAAALAPEVRTGSARARRHPVLLAQALPDAVCAVQLPDLPRT